MSKSSEFAVSPFPSLHLWQGYPEGEDGCSLMSRSLSALRNAAKLGEVAQEFGGDVFLVVPYSLA